MGKVEVKITRWQFFSSTLLQYYISNIMTTVENSVISLFLNTTTNETIRNLLSFLKSSVALEFTCLFFLLFLLFMKTFSNFSSITVTTQRTRIFDNNKKNSARLIYPFLNFILLCTFEWVHAHRIIHCKTLSYYDITPRRGDRTTISRQVISLRFMMKVVYSVKRCRW